MSKAGAKKLPKKVIRSNILENKNSQSELLNILKNKFNDLSEIIYDYMCESNELYEMFINEASPEKLIYLNFCNVVPQIEFNTIIKYRYYGKKIMDPCNLSLYIDKLANSKDYHCVSALVRFYFNSCNPIYKDYLKKLYMSLTYSDYNYVANGFDILVIKYIDDPIMISIYNEIKLSINNVLLDNRYIEKAKEFIEYFEREQLTDKNIKSFINKLNDEEYKLLESYRTKMYKNINSIYWLIHKINNKFDELKYNEFIKNCEYTKNCKYTNRYNDVANNRNMKLALILNHFDDEFIINNIDIIINNEMYFKNHFLDCAIIGMIEKFIKFPKDEYILQKKELFTKFIMYNIDIPYIKNSNKKKLIQLIDANELFEYNVNKFCTLFIDEIDNSNINNKLILIDSILKKTNIYDINDQSEISIIYFLDRYYNLIDYSSASKFSNLILKHNNTRAIRILSNYFVG